MTPESKAESTWTWKDEVKHWFGIVLIGVMFGVVIVAYGILTGMFRV